MASAWGALRRLILAPSLDEVGFAARGFEIEPTDGARRLEAVPQAVVCGFEWGIADRDLAETERRLSMVDQDLRGFAYEGATMASAVRDAMGPRGGGRTRALLEGGGRPHIFLNYIGVGFAMARLPRPLWKKTLPALTDPDLYPAMSWLAVDGYGFDLAYFHTSRWVGEQRVPEPYAFEGDAGYFPRAVDQGIGRALWFIHGGRTDRVAAAVGRFAEARRADLWSGVGLAATFAGGSDPASLAALREDSAGHAAHLAQGSAFAAKGRHRAGFVPEHTRQAAHAFTGLDVESVARLADDCAPGGTTTGNGPAYETWRRNMRERVFADAL